MTYALRETRALAAHAPAAPMAPDIALMALAALGLSGYPVHEPVHAQYLPNCLPSVIGRLMCDAVLPPDVRRMAQELLAAVRGRWPLVLRTGWVVVRRITWV